MPVTQKKLSRLEMKRNSSQLPICARERWLLVNTMLIIRKVRNLSSCTACSPEMLSMIFSLLKLSRYESETPGCRNNYTILFLVRLSYYMNELITK